MIKYFSFFWYFSYFDFLQYFFHLLGISYTSIFCPTFSCFLFLVQFFVFLYIDFLPRVFLFFRVFVCIYSAERGEVGGPRQIVSWSQIFNHVILNGFCITIGLCVKNGFFCQK